MYIKHVPARVHIKGYKRDDCTIVAIGNALGLSYDLARKVLQTASYRNDMFSFRIRNPRPKYEFHLQTHVEEVCEALTVSNKRYPSEAAKGRISLHQFAKENNKGTYLVLVDRHLTTVIDGCIVDAWDSRARKVVVAYEVNVEHGRQVIKKLARHYRMIGEKHFIEGHIGETLQGKQHKTEQQAA